MLLGLAFHEARSGEKGKVILQDSSLSFEGNQTVSK